MISLCSKNIQACIAFSDFVFGPLVCSLESRQVHIRIIILRNFRGIATPARASKNSKKADLFSEELGNCPRKLWQPQFETTQLS